ncbi:MAG: hypothetical protein ACK5MJ_07360 [Alphaproteobacteria bacterium]
MLRYIIIIAIVALSFFTKLFAVAQPQSTVFETYDWNKYSVVYKDLVFEAKDNDEILSKLWALSEDERVELLIYIGLHNQDDFKNEEFKKVKILITEVLAGSADFVRGTYNYENGQFVQLLVPYVRNMMTGSQYDQELKRLYTKIAKRNSLDFWKSYDVFKNMLVFGDKNKTLYIEKETSNGMRKVINPEFKTLEQYLSADIKKVTDLIGMDAPVINIVYAENRIAAAWYRKADNSININMAYDNLSWPKLTGDVIWHELYHAYQYYMVETYLDGDIDEMKTELTTESDAIEAGNIWLAAVYNANMMSYQASTLSYSRYRSQPIEAGAWDFGNSMYKAAVTVN